MFYIDSRLQYPVRVETPNPLFARDPALPIPNSFPLDQENQDYSHVFLGFDRDGSEPPRGRWSEGETLDGRGEFTSRPMEPQGEEPSLAAARPERAPQNEQL